jgi:hypothetical protein
MSPYSPLELRELAERLWLQVMERDCKFRDKLAAAERDNERLRERPTLPWKKGPAQGEDCPIYDGDCFLVAVSVCKDSQAPEKGYVTEYEVVRVSCDEHYSAVETMRGDDWGWDWSDVEWFLPVAALTPPTEGGGV